MSITNPGFETGDATPSPPAGGGTAPTGWTVTYVSTGSAWANFGDSTITEGSERFERNWSSNEAFVFTLSGATVAIFNPAGPYASTAEGFEALWSSNESFSFGLGRLEQLNFGAGLLGAEDFEVEWSTNESYKFSFVDADLFVSPAGVETFETNWRSNEAYLTAFAPGNLITSSFDGTSPQRFEDFEEVDFHLWKVTVDTVVWNADYAITVENALAQYHSSNTETSASLASQLRQLVNNLGQHYIATPTPYTAGFYLSIDERIVSNPLLDVASLLDSAGVAQVSGPSGPGGPVLTLERVDATSLWTQAGKLFSIQ